MSGELNYQALREWLIELSGRDGKSGELGRLRERLVETKAELAAEQIRSSADQGRRIGDRETKEGELRTIIDGLKAELAAVKIQGVDTKVRLATYVSFGFSMVAVVLAVWKLFM